MKKFLVVILLTLLTLPAIRDLFKPGGYTSHDLTHHIVRTIQMDKILHEGQFPPRWTGDLNYGYGYPLFLFNYPLPSMIAVGIHFLGANYTWSVKLTMALSLIGSAILAFITFRYIFKSYLAGFVGSLFFLYAPIRFLNIYVSATFGNAVAFMFVPLIFWSLTKAARNEFDKPALIGGSLSLAGLILSHNIMALMFLPIVFAYAIFLFWQTPDNRKKLFTVYFLFFTLLGLGLSAWFLLPAVFEKNLIRYDVTLIGFYKTHFPAWWQLIRSHWGYGFSHPGTEQDDMSFQIGLAQLLVVIACFIVVIKRFFFCKQKTTLTHQKIALFWLGIFFLSVFLMLEISDPIWRVIPWLAYLQMPWRLLAVSVFAASFLAAWLVVQFRCTVLISLTLSLAVLVANRNHLRINQIYDPGEDFYKSINNTTSMASEHLPKGADKFDNFPPATSKFNILTHKAEISYLKNTSTLVTASISSPKDTQIRFNQIYFPGWHYFIDGQEIKPQYEPAHPLPIFEFKSGTHQFSAQFRNTPIRNIADIISLVSLLILILSSVKTVYDPKKTRLANN